MDSVVPLSSQKMISFFNFLGSGSIPLENVSINLDGNSYKFDANTGTWAFTSRNKFTFENIYFLHAK